MSEIKHENMLCGLNNYFKQGWQCQCKQMVIDQKNPHTRNISDCLNKLLKKSTFTCIINNACEKSSF